MVTDTQETHEQIHAALGRYVTAFSGLIYALETSTAHLIFPFPSEDRILVEVLISDQTAHPIATKFFSVFTHKWQDVLTSDDTAILKEIRKSTMKAIEVRNRFMHDAWLMIRTVNEVIEDEFSIHRVRPHGGGVDYQHSRITTEELNRRSQELRSLASVINGLAFHHNPNVEGPDISSRFRIDDGSPVRI